MEPLIGDAAGNGAAPLAGDLIKDSDTANFLADVVEMSKEIPVIVDFWAEWCGPCKQLGPMIEKVVTEAGGAVKLVKIDTDKNQELAQQLRVQSIPTVYGFSNGQPVDVFTGALPESEIKAFVDRVLQAAGKEAAPESPIAHAMGQAATARETGDWDTAGAIYSQVLQHEPANIAAAGGLARALVEKDELDAAREVLSGIPDDAAEAADKDADVIAARAALELAEKAADAGDMDEARARVEADPKDHQARFDLAIGLFATGAQGEAIEALIEIIRRERAWNEEAARVQLLEFFEALGPTDELTLDGRRKLSSVLFS